MLLAGVLDPGVGEDFIKGEGPGVPNFCEIHLGLVLPGMSVQA